MWTRRRPGLLVLALLLVGALVGCTAAGAGAGPTRPPSEPPSSAPDASEPPRSNAPSPRASPVDRCAALVDRMSVREQVGQLFMVGVASSGLESSDSDALGDSQAGSVILLGNTTAGRSSVVRVTGDARAAAPGPARISVLLAADQEGGQVQRLRGDGFLRIPSASEQAELDDAELTSRAGRWGRELRAAGIRANLAPVADVVPAELQDLNAPIGQLRRGYGSDPGVVADKVTAFVRGMDAAGVATAVKHFPGLGRVRGNTDFEAGVTDRVTRRDDEALAGFRAGIQAGADMVMMSSATYARIEPDHRAAFSSTIMQTLRSDLGFTGVIISDDLAARALEDVRPRARALRFLRAGGDLAIVGDSSLVVAMADAVADAAAADPEFAAQVRAKATRVVRMKERRGLADC